MSKKAIFAYETISEARRRPAIYFIFTYTERLHSSLGYRIPIFREEVRNLTTLPTPARIFQWKVGDMFYREKGRSLLRKTKLSVL